MRAGITCGLVAALVFGAGHAAADDAARQHFEAGKRLRAEGDCARAIPELERSLATERSIGALYNLGYCHERLGHRPEAYDAYRGARELASQRKDPRVREISGALAALLETPHVRLVLPEPLPAGLLLTVDDEPVPAASYATETVVFTRATRTHQVVITAPGYETRRLTVETRQVAPVELQRATPPTPPREGPAATTATAGTAGAPPGRTVGVVLLAGGVLTAGVATYLFVDHRSEIGDLDTQLDKDLLVCTGKECDAAKSSHNDAVTSANRRAWAKVGGTAAASAALLVAGALFLALTPPNKPPAATWLVVPRFGREGNGAAIEGRF